MHSNGVPLDSYSLCTSLKASAFRTSSTQFGKQIHTHVTKLGFMSSVFVGSALIDLYVKSLLIGDASKVFDEIPMKNSVCANALLSGYEEAHMWNESLKLIQLMGGLRLMYDRFTLSAILRLSASLSMIEFGRQAHGFSLRTISDVEADLYLQSSLIEMYGKCGFVEKAQNVFSLMGIRREEKRKRDVVLWTSMIGVYGRNGRFEDVIALFKDMLIEEVRPDGLVFLTVITACGYAGNVKLGFDYFESMVRDFGLEPDLEHYSCVVDMLCKAGELEKAFELVNVMPFEGSVSMWGALLSASMNCGNVEMGKLAAQRALKMDPQNVGIYVLLSNLYAKVGMWSGIEELRETMKARGLTKDMGCSWI
ncbi:Pentatricopeptide repeat-containing protein [Thalictrum thalictroides]|uniref:Pentatricopeptide repeat-containing protein n=1 Tax=Thalictrum thalictroides TaxID=46969 RepID=A0A7J6WNA6_THATH|nr:Pentatricopeptide repeat-containing protein [Thalictrum thalictroides]